MLDAIVLSDLHLGAETCHVRPLQEFFGTLPETRKLILNGDVLENTEYRLTKQHWRVLSQLRRLSDQLELIWIRGNHDYDAEPVAHLVGATFVGEYMFESGGQQVLCLHGDVWDRFLTDHPVLTFISDWFYINMQRMSRRLAISAKHKSKTVLHVHERVRTEAIDYGRNKCADIVICGHTHHAEAIDESRLRSPAYFNSGSWTDHHCSYLTVNSGNIQLECLDVDSMALAEALA